MRSTFVLPDELVAKARAISGIELITDLVKEGLNALIAREDRKRLVSYDGTDPLAGAAPRNRDYSIAVEPQTQ
jgi:hypothetical protein